MIQQAIVTRYHGATNTKGARVSATSGSGIRLYLPWDYALDHEANHRAACQALAFDLDWGQNWVQGSLKTGYAFVALHE